MNNMGNWKTLKAGTGTGTEIGNGNGNRNFLELILMTLYLTTLAIST